MEMHDGGFGFPRSASRVARHKYRTAVASPAAVRGMDNKLDVLEIRGGASQIAARQFFLGFVANENADEFAFSDFSDHFSIHPANRVNFSRPVRFIMRPSEPGSLMSRPLGRHRKAKFRGSRTLFSITFAHNAREDTAFPGNVHSGYF